MKQYSITFTLALAVVSISCSSVADSDGDLPLLSVADIIREYRIVDSLNVLSFGNQLDTSSIDRYVVLGKDIRNDAVVIRRCEARLLGCILYENVFGLFYEDGDSSWCNQVGGVKVIDYEGFAGLPRYVGCAPDTS